MVGERQKEFKDREDRERQKERAREAEKQHREKKQRKKTLKQQTALKTSELSIFEATTSTPDGRNSRTNSPVANKDAAQKHNKPLLQHKFSENVFESHADRMKRLKAEKNTIGQRIGNALANVQEMGNMFGGFFGLVGEAQEEAKKHQTKKKVEKNVAQKQHSTAALEPDEIKELEKQPTLNLEPIVIAVF